MTEETNTGKHSEILMPNCVYNPAHNPNLCFGLPSVDLACMTFDLNEQNEEVIDMFAAEPCEIGAEGRMKMIYRC